jgi:hypothetical protein
MQPVVYAATGKLVINDFQDGDDTLIVVDITTGAPIDRAGASSQVANGMFLTAGEDRDVYYCSTLAISRVRWQ